MGTWDFKGDKGNSQGSNEKKCLVTRCLPPVYMSHLEKSFYQKKILFWKDLNLDFSGYIREEQKFLLSSHSLDGLQLKTVNVRKWHI